MGELGDPDVAERPTRAAGRVGGALRAGHSAAGRAAGALRAGLSAAGAGDGAGAGRQLAVVPSSSITRVENGGTDDDGDDDSDDDEDDLLLSSLVSQSGHLLAE